MIDEFEIAAYRHPDRAFFVYVSASGKEDVYSFRQTRILSAGLAALLHSKGVKPGDVVAVDLPNHFAGVFLLLAAAYGGFSLLLLNNRLSEAEKLSRVQEAGFKGVLNIGYRINRDNVDELMQEVVSLLYDKNTVRISEEAVLQRGSGINAAGVVSRDERINFRFDDANNLSPRAGRSRVEFNAKGGSYAGTAASRLNKAYQSGVASASAQNPNAAHASNSFQHHGRGKGSAIASILHYAEHARHVYNPQARAIVMFTSGTSGRSKMVPLTWDNLCGAAQASNEVLVWGMRGKAAKELAPDGEAQAVCWQLALPMYHVGGLQIIVRSILADARFILYARFQAQRILRDALRYKASHISVVDKMLREMLDCSHADAMKNYRCILLGGAATNPDTLERCRSLQLSLFGSYGMTETASHIAFVRYAKNSASENAAVSLGARIGEGMRLLPGYRAQVVDKGEDGFGRLAVSGPGVFSGYLNAKAAHTLDGYFLTGDSAAFIEGRLYVKERTEDMFVSGGENVYPAEIREKLLGCDGVADAFVMGVVDEQWGRRPVAFVQAKPGLKPGAALRFAETLADELEPSLSKLYFPKHIFVMDELLQTALGKPDRAAFEQLYANRIEIRQVELIRIRLPFISPISTAQTTLYERESIIVRVTDHAGRTGIAECVAFTTKWYLPETLDEDEAFLKEELAPLLLNKVLLHPRRASELFATNPRADALPLACGALEPALWDLYGKIVEKPLWALLVEGLAQNEIDFMRRKNPVLPFDDSSLSSIWTTMQDYIKQATPKVKAGAVVGLMPKEETLEAVARCVNAGYTRVKLKVKHGSVPVVQAVRDAFPDLMMSLDANGAFGEQDIDEITALDACEPCWIEEPLNRVSTAQSSSSDIFIRLAALQSKLRTRVCLDESVQSLRDLWRAMSQSSLSCYALKVGKLGGVQPTLELISALTRKDALLWMGGMYETGVSKRLHAAFQMLPMISAPGDIGSTVRVFPFDITEPAYTAEKGSICLHRPSKPYGLGCELNEALLSRCTVSRTVIKK